MAMQIIRLENTCSTNEYLLHIAAKQPGWEGIVVSDYQSAGKGMGTNTWESEAGQNLLFSILVHPSWLPIRHQYLLSMAEAIAICEVLSGYTKDITIKWPNDIYWKDKKISGTRIDTNISGNHISDMVISTGININQRTFISDAPNPISLWQITGKENDKDIILNNILTAFENYSTMLREGNSDAIVKRYHDNLYRSEGYHWYKDANGEFEAKTIEVLPNGTLRLQRMNGIINEYMFKEVEFLFPPY